MASHTRSLLRPTFVVAVACVSNAIWAQTSTTQATAHGERVPAIKVKFSDLNLASEEGSRVLYARLVSAAEQVCPRASDTLLSIKENLTAQKCIRDAVDRAAKQISNPRFAEVAASHRR